MLIINKNYKIKKNGLINILQIFKQLIINTILKTIIITYRININYNIFFNYFLNKFILVNKIKTIRFLNFIYKKKI